ncbi:hypothetical protein ABK046_48400, partial [Streptomyces caeruleatus]
APSEAPDGALFPQTPSGENSPQSTVNFEIEDTQAQTVQAGGNIQPANTTQQQTTALAKEGLSCSAATILGSVLSSAISSALSEIIG